MANIAQAIIVHNHIYLARRTNVPCPLPGRGNCLIATDLDGAPAYWLERVVYVLKRNAYPLDYPGARMVTL